MRGQIFSSDVVSGSMIGRGTDNWKTCREIDAVTGSNMLEWNQSLVMVHRKDRIKLGIGISSKETICREWPKTEDIFFICFLNGWLDDIPIFSTDQPIITGMRVQAEYSNLWFLNPEILLQALIHHP